MSRHPVTVRQASAAVPLSGTPRLRLATAVMIASTALAAIALGFMSVPQRYVAGPGFACALIVLWLFLRLLREDRMVPLFDVGFLCAFVTFVYSVYPLLNYWAGGLRFSYDALNDTRLAAYDPSPVQIGMFHLRHVVYLSCLVVGYAGLRGRGAIRSGPTRPLPIAVEYIIAILFIALTGCFAVLRAMTGIDYHPSYQNEAFARTVEAASSAPLWLLQISGKLAGIASVLKLSLLYMVVSRSRNRRWFVVLVVWIGAETVNAVASRGARGGLMFFLIGALLLYHRLVRPLSFGKVIAAGVTVFTVFMGMGLYRSFTDLTTLRFEMRQAGVGLFGGNNEFQALLGTAYDVAQRKAAGTELPGYLYVNDIIDILPPQQLLPFRKIPASEWYLREIGAAGTGEGYMWGVITQAIVGFDWVELAVRGVILGALLALFHRWYRKRQHGFVETFVYMYLCIHVFATFRNTTLSIMANVVWELIPFIALILATRALPAGYGDTPPRIAVQLGSGLRGAK